MSFLLKIGGGELIILVEFFIKLLWEVNVWLVVRNCWVVVCIWVDVVWGDVCCNDCWLLSLWVVVDKNCWVSVDWCVCVVVW